jgi:hypothetical protein
MDIEQRSRLRADARLPLLNVEAENKRLTAIREKAEFEHEWEKRRLELCHEWTGNRDGWFTNMGRWLVARQRIRQEIQK